MTIKLTSFSGKEYEMDWFYKGESGHYVGRLRDIHEDLIAHSLDGLLRTAVDKLQLVESYYTEV